jgi:hypothetical protein
MVSNIPSYMYSLFASLLIGSILVCAVSVETGSIRNSADQHQLENIQQYVAAQALTLIAQTTIEGQNTTQYLDIPSAIDNQRFYICLQSDQESAWVASGFDLNMTASYSNPTAVPAKATAQGSFLSGSGRPLLECHYQNQVATLTLTQE